MLYTWNLSFSFGHTWSRLEEKSIKFYCSQNLANFCFFVFLGAFVPHAFTRNAIERKIDSKYLLGKTIFYDYWISAMTKIKVVMFPRPKGNKGSIDRKDLKVLFVRFNANWRRIGARINDPTISVVAFQVLKFSNSMSFFESFEPIFQLLTFQLLT